jgi:Acetyltransferases, including N-acetylases of ribosomal proteins
MFSPHPVTLQRGALRLAPLMEADIPELVALAERNRGELTFMNGPLRPDWYRHALAEQRDGRAVVFSIRMAERLIGTTRFADFVSSLPAAELGWTLAGSGRARHRAQCLDQVPVAASRVRGMAAGAAAAENRASNLRSQRAIEKLGAAREGVLRNHRRLADGRLDDTVLYSITDRDWPQVRQRLASE